MHKKDLEDLYEVLKLVVQFKEKIINIVESEDLEELPPSVVDTDIFLSVLEGYTYMYDYLLEHSLIKAGNPKINQQRTH